MFFRKYCFRFITRILLIGISLSCFAGATEIVVEGNQRMSSRKIRSLAQVPDNFPELSRYDIQKWKNTARIEIQYAYENEGFLDIQVGIDVRKDSVDEEEIWYVSIIIQQGPRYTFGSVDILTADSSLPLLDTGSLETRPGRFINPDIPGRDKRKIEKIYGESGFARRQVKLEYVINDSLKKVDVTFLVDPSYLVVFDSLIIRNRREKQVDTGGGLTDQAFLHDILRISPGDTVKLSQTNAFKDKLKSTRAFNFVRLRDSLVPERDHKSLLVLNLEERVPGRINSALFWESEDGIGAETGWAHKNILGKFYGVKTYLRMAWKRQNLSLGLANPLLFGYRLRWDNDLDLTWRQDPGLNQSEFDAILTSSLSRFFTKWLRFTGTLEFEGTSIKSVDESTVGGIDSIKISRVVNMNTFGTLSLSFLDEEFDPSRGSRFAFTLGNGGPFIDANNEFRAFQLRHNWVELKTAYYIPATSFLTCALRIDGGLFTDDAVTNSRRFFLGGRKSIRSEEFRDICPERKLYFSPPDSVMDCNPEVAPVYYLTSAELRLKILKGLRIRNESIWKNLQMLQVVPFTDYGKIWDLGQPVRDEGKGFDVGLGLRLPVLVFNVRFDYAVGWENGPEWDKYRFLIDLTQAF